MTKTLGRSLMLSLLLSVVVLSLACAPENAPAPTPTPTPAVAATIATPIPAASIAALKPEDEVAVITTKHGTFKIRFFPEVAPRHVEHFKKLANEGFYTGLAFHRVVPDRLIQGGDPTSRRNDRTMWGKGEPGQENVPAEFSSLPFGRGTVGAARKGGDINSASSQFFVCLERNPGWDGQYTVFGEVIDGLDVVEKISQQPSDPSQVVLDKVVMNRVQIEKAGAAAAKK